MKNPRELYRNTLHRLKWKLAPFNPSDEDLGYSTDELLGVREEYESEKYWVYTSTDETGYLKVKNLGPWKETQPSEGKVDDSRLEKAYRTVRNQVSR